MLNYIIYHSNNGISNMIIVSVIPTVIVLFLPICLYVHLLLPRALRNIILRN